MALPVLAKGWQLNLNHRVAAAGGVTATSQAVMLYLKSVLTTAPFTWTVIGSSNAVASGMDAVDRWVTGSNLTFNIIGQPHSWTVLQQSSINAKFQICIECTTNTGLATVVVSPTVGFGLANGGTNGSTTTRPTATDEYTILSSGGGYMTGTGAMFNEDFLINAWQSTDGQVTRLVGRRPQQATNQFTMYAAFERPKNPVAAWTNPCIATWNADSSGALRYATLNDVAQYFGNKPGGGSMNLLATTEHFANAAVGEQITTVNDLTGGHQLTPMGLVSQTAGARGRHGEIFDIWYGVTTLQDGDTYPIGGSKQFIQAGNLVLPWDGSSPIMT